MSSIFISGASKGIGRAIAKRFDVQGNTVIGCARGQEQLDALAADFEQAEFISLAMDLSSAEGPGVLKSYFEEKGYPDIVIANMNHIRPYSRLEKYPDADDFTEGLTHHIRYLIEILPGTLRRQRETGFGRWIGVSSVVSEVRGMAGMGYYLIQKRMLEGLIDTIVLEADHTDITANIVQPGIIATERISSSKSHEMMAEFNLMKRSGLSEEVAHAVHFLTQADSRFITGERLKIDGGSTRTWYINDLIKNLKKE